MPHTIRSRFLIIFAGVSLLFIVFSLFIERMEFDFAVFSVLITGAAFLSGGIGLLVIIRISKPMDTFLADQLKQGDRMTEEDKENRLIQSEKQASIGRLAAGVAHEINNPLTGVLTFSHLLLRRKDLPKEVQQDLQTIADSTELVRDIVKGLLDFARQTEINPVSTDINNLIRNTIQLIRNQALVKGVLLCFNPDENLPNKVVDKNQMESVILNMLINAIDSTEKGGHIVISTGLSLPPEIKPYAEQGIEIKISDTGCGIPPENINKLFEPFFTTKEVGKGTGLGLAVSYGIIERHGGTIHVKSKVNDGSIFTIWLPQDKEDYNGHSHSG